MSKKLITSLIILILLAGGGFVFLQTQRGKIFEYEFKKKIDKVVFELKNDKAELVDSEDRDPRLQEKEERNLASQKSEQKVIEYETRKEEEKNFEGEVPQPRPQNEEIEPEPVKPLEEKPAPCPEEDEISSVDEVVDNNIENDASSTPASTDASLGGGSGTSSVTEVGEFVLDVPFAAQAPHGNWDLPYQEACEESSAIMAARYVLGQLLDADIMDQEILKLVEWEQEAFGYYFHTSGRETSIIIEEYFDLSSEIIENPSVDDLKNILYSGKPILVPAAGRELGNPYYTAPGPIYHMLVLIGWQGNRWITNDPGTRHGEHFSYTMDDFMAAIHDCPMEGDGDVSQEMILSGPKRVIVVGK